MARKWIRAIPKPLFRAADWPFYRRIASRPRPSLTLCSWPVPPPPHPPLLVRQTKPGAPKKPKVPVSTAHREPRSIAMSHPSTQGIATFISPGARSAQYVLPRRRRYSKGGPRLPSMPPAMLLLLLTDR